jgi:3-hydroxymyristoyl/3-hydroxydecanoyl-(acyl carrier protein) dehydratase
MDHCQIIKELLPYQPPFLFVDRYLRIDEKGVEVGKMNIFIEGTSRATRSRPVSS